MPITLRCTEQHLHVRKDIANFVVPLGATVNMDGTALYEAAAALFVARLAGIELDLASQMIIFFVAMLGAIGAPGIPSVGMLSMVLVLESVGLPVCELLGGGGMLIVDVRKGTGGLELLRRKLGQVSVLHEEERFQRIRALK